MKIYADVLFLINFISTYILLDLTARITRRHSGLKRLVAAAAAGAAIAIASFCLEEYGGLLKIISAILLPLIAFGKKDILRGIAVFAAANIIMAAIFAFINGINHSQTIIMRRGIMYFNIPVMRFLIIFAISYAAFSVLIWIIKRRKYVPLHSIIISLKDKSTRITALVDSGNVLKEPVTGKDVIIAEWDKIKPLFGNIEYCELKKTPDKYKLWLVPYHSLGNTGGLIYAFLADDINIVDEQRRTGKLFIGITNEKLSSKNEYHALMGASV